jgi:hypothetical protein
MQKRDKYNVPVIPTNIKLNVSNGQICRYIRQVSGVMTQNIERM